MPQWTSEPQAEPEGFAFRMVRTPPDRPVIGLVTCTDLVGVNTHWTLNRTLPCDGEQTCQYCQQGLSKRWHGYVSAMDPRTLEHFLFEFTAHASDSFRNFMQLHGNLRACHFKAYRPSKRPNGRVIIHCSAGDETRMRLPSPPDLHRVLCHIWGVEYSPPASSQPLLTALADKLHHADGTDHLHPDGRPNRSHRHAS